MPKNKNFQLRIEILDEFLGSPRRRTFQELLELLSERLVEEGESRVSKRTLYDDLNYLENKLGAPIKRATKSDPHIYYSEKFSIKNVPIDDEDVSLLRQAIEILKKATDLNINKDLEAIISKLENKVHTNVPNRATMIAFEEHTKASGQEYLDDLFSAIQEKCSVKITYQPFGKDPREWVVHPYMLKEYRNRWFLICRKSGSHTPTCLALDRMKKLANCVEEFQENDLFDPDTYFNDIIGVTFPEGNELENIVISVKPESADYILTKPIHKSQELLKTYANGSLKIQVKLYINYELKSYLLSYGPKIEVLEPVKLREEMKELYATGLELYR